MSVRDLIRPLASLEALDPIGEWLSTKVNGLITGTTKSVLSGTWLGHPLHPVLTDIPVGALTAATLVDILGGEDGGSVSDALTAIGLLAVVPTAVTGLSDWSDTVDEERRVGLVHALANVSGATLYLAALVTRHGGSRKVAGLFSLAGLGVLGVGGYLGGHLVFGRGIGVDHTVFDTPPTEWTRVARESDLVTDTPALANAAGYGVLLYRHAGMVHAIGARCTHAGGPLDEGEVDGDLCVTCPWHGSRFRLADGSVVAGPATAPEPAFEVRVTDGNVEVRLREG
jgi:nitrite reductase/ring-hydroxylating ferredoxin subunit/uncharacterized membrane protein